MKEEKQSTLGERSKVELSFLFVSCGALVWLLSHLLPVEARVEAHETKIQNLDAKMTAVLENTQYIRAKVDMMTERAGRK